MNHLFLQDFCFPNFIGYPDNTTFVRSFDINAPNSLAGNKPFTALGEDDIFAFGDLSSSSLLVTAWLGGLGVTGVGSPVPMFFGPRPGIFARAI